MNGHPPVAEFDDSILDSLFHSCALAAFVERAIIEGRSPDPESTRRLAYRLYEASLAERHRGTK